VTPQGRVEKGWYYLRYARSIPSSTLTKESCSGFIWDQQARSQLSAKEVEELRILW